MRLGQKHSFETKKKIGLASLGRKPTTENIEKMRLGRLGKMPSDENHHAWKSDNVGYCSLHQWIRKHLPRSELCEICNKNLSRDLANMTGIYNRDFKNWKYLCRSCHFKYDKVNVGT